MENKNVNENVKVENKGTEIVIEKQEEQRLKLFVEREGFTGSNGEQYWAYVVKGQVRGRNVKVDFMPKDKGGYEVLDIVFSASAKAELIICNETMTDSNGKITRYVSYKVQTKDELGELECGVKPSRDSDKALLTMLINQLNATAKK